MKAHHTIDRRRFDERGRRRDIRRPPRAVDFDDIQQPLKKAFAYVRTHLERVPSRRPQEGELIEPAALALGFVRSTSQLYSGTIRLLAEHLVFPAGILARGLVEGVGNLMAILEDPDEAPRAFGRDDFYSVHRKLQYYEERWNTLYDHEHAVREGARLGLSAAEILAPQKKWKWPGPSDLARRDRAPRLLGERRTVFRELYNFWYGSLSAMAHHRMTALELATFTDERKPSERHETTFEMVKGMTAVVAAVTSLCVLSEVEAHFQLPVCTDLRVSWETARTMDKLNKAIYEARYARLLAMPET